MGSHVGTAKSYEEHTETVKELKARRKEQSVVAAQLRAQLSATSSSLSDDVAAAVVNTKPPEGADAKEFRSSLVATVATILSAAIPAGALTAEQAAVLAGLGASVAYATAAAVEKATQLRISVSGVKSTFNVAEYL